MSNNVFPLKEAGDFFNKHFVSVEFDMEKGEGLEIAKKYGVKVYPTFLLLDATGAARYRVVGASDLDGFIARVKRGMDPKNAIALLEKEYATGKMKKERMLAYFVALQDAYDAKLAANVKEELLARLTTAEKLTSAYWPVIKSNTPEMLAFVEANRATLEKNIGKEAVSEFLNGTSIALLNAYITKGERTDAGERLCNTIKTRVEHGEITPNAALSLKLKMADAISAGEERARFVELLFEDLNRLSSDELLEFGFVFGDLDMEDKLLMNKVAAIADAIIEKAPVEIKPGLIAYFDEYKRAAATGVYWENLTLEEALAKAGKENKRVFMDCYTIWCGPCTYMATTIFTRPAEGDFFNSRFVNVKYDMEKGEGVEIAKKYGVNAYPMFIILNPDGSVQHKILGSTESIIEEATKGLDDATASGVLDRRYDGGDRDKVFLLSYLERLVENSDMERAREVYATLEPLLTDVERTSPRLWFLYEDNELCGDGSALFTYMLSRVKAFEASVGKAVVEEKIADVYKRKLYPVLLGQEKPEPGALLALKRELAPYKLKSARELFACINITDSYAAGDPDKLLKVAGKELKHLTEENADIAIFTLNYLRQNTTGHLDELRAMAGKLKKRFTIEEYKEILTKMFDEQASTPPGEEE
jgi:thiol-disulfide isomerase/thioredoxin